MRLLDQFDEINKNASFEGFDFFYFQLVYAGHKDVWNQDLALTSDLTFKSQERPASSRNTFEHFFRQLT